MSCHCGVTRDFIAPVLAVGTSVLAIWSSLSEMALCASSDNGSGQWGTPPVCQSALKEDGGNGLCAPAPRRSIIVAGIAALVTGVVTVTPAGMWPGYQITSATWISSQYSALPWVLR